MKSKDPGPMPGFFFCAQKETLAEEYRADSQVHWERSASYHKLRRKRMGAQEEQVECFRKKAGALLGNAVLLPNHV
jgi:hypothetical protein